MATRLDGFYYVQFAGILTPGDMWGQGVLFLKDGRVYGGDSLSMFVGEYKDENGVVTASAMIYPMNVAYTSITGGVENRPWDLPDIRGPLSSAAGPLDENLEVELTGQRYDTHQAITLRLKRMMTF